MIDNRVDKIKLPKGLNVDVDIEPTTGIIYERYYLPGEAIRFNLDGMPFRFEEFLLEVQRKDEDQKLIDILIHVESEAPQNLVYIANALNYSLPEGIQENESVNFILGLKKDVIENGMNPKITKKEDTDIQKLYSYKDPETNQYYLTDFFFFEIRDIY